MPRVKSFIGTSGWSYTSWKPVFYPPEVKSKDFLRYYATRLKTLEINYTFNHLQTEKNIAAWQEATPPEFLFALKASQHITHVRQLQDPAETLPIFFDRARPLGDRLGPVLFQTPPWLRRDDDRLAGFLASLPRDLRSALEVRNLSWYVDEVYELLRTAGVALVHAEGEKAPSPADTLGTTSDFAAARSARGLASRRESAVARVLGRARQSARAAELDDDRGRPAAGRAGSPRRRRRDELDRHLVPHRDGSAAADRRAGGGSSRASQRHARRARLLRRRVRGCGSRRLDLSPRRLPHQSGDRGGRPGPEWPRSPARGDPERPAWSRVRDRERGDRGGCHSRSARRGIA